MIKLALFDMDGTLLDSDRQLPNDFSAYVKNLREYGVTVAIASARPHMMLNVFPEDAGDLYISGENGKIFYCGNKCLASFPLPYSDVKFILDTVWPDDDIATICFSDDIIYTTERDRLRFIDFGRADLFTKAPHAPDESTETCQLHCLCRGGYEMAERKVTDEYAFLREKYDLELSGSGWIDIMEKGRDKGDAVTFFADYFGYSPDEIAVFGDSENDIPMFRRAKYSFAMKNAMQDIKKEAAFITKEDNNHCGALKALWELVLSQNK